MHSSVSVVNIESRLAPFSKISVAYPPLKNTHVVRGKLLEASAGLFPRGA